MARLLSVVLLLSLAVAPAVAAEPPGRGESLYGGWFDAFRGALNRVFSWFSTVRSEPRESGADIDPSGVAAPPPDGAGLQATLEQSGAYINPSGIRAVLAGRGNAGLREAVAIRRGD